MAAIPRRLFLKQGALAAGGFMLGSGLRAWGQAGNKVEGHAGKQPNIIVILVDDMGWGDLSCQPQEAGRPDARLRTPHLDSMAAEGARCTQAYATCMVCAPSRAGLLTGRYQQRFGWYEFKETLAGIPRDIPTLAEVLQKNGYATACFGKWHLGYEPQMGPLKRGFERFYGFLGGQHDYFDPCNGDPIHAFPHDLDAWILDQEEPVDSMDYLTDELTKQTLKYIDAQAKMQEPFFIYLAYNSPHPPMQSTWEKLEPYARQRPGRVNQRDLARAMIDSIDEGVGRILDRLMHLGLNEDTLIIFSSDNGGHDDGKGGILVQHNGGLRGRKGFYWEGGIRVPFLVRWPRKIPEGVVYDFPVSQLDIFSTAIAAASVKGEELKLDGVDLTPYLCGTCANRPHEVLYWAQEEDVKRWSVRKGDWKLTLEFVDPQTTYDETFKKEKGLHNLAADPFEENNLIETHPDITAELESLMKAFYATCTTTLATPELMDAWKKEYDRRLEKRPEPNKLRRDGAPGHWL